MQLITARYLQKSLGKGKGFLIIPANKSGLVYKTDIVTSMLQVNPDKFIETQKLKPLFRLFWVPELEDLIVSGVKEDGSVDLNADLDPDIHAKAIALIGEQFPRLNQCSDYFPADDLDMMAIKSIMSMQKVTAEQAKGNAARLLADLDRKDRLVIASLYSLEVNPALTAALEFNDDRIISLALNEAPDTVDVESSEVDIEDVEKASIDSLTASTAKAKKTTTK